MVKALAECNNSQAARLLGISRETVRRLRKQHGIPLPTIEPRQAQHGTRAGYMAHGAKKEDAEADCPKGENGLTCAEAHRRYQREYMRRKGGFQPRKPNNEGDGNASDG